MNTKTIALLEVGLDTKYRVAIDKALAEIRQMYDVWMATPKLKKRPDFFTLFTVSLINHKKPLHEALAGTHAFDGAYRIGQSVVRQDNPLGRAMTEYRQKIGCTQAISNFEFLFILALPDYDPEVQHQQ